TNYTAIPDIYPLSLHDALPIFSQGAKPGKGGVLPGAKITKEISEIRGVPMGVDVLSPPNHSAFNNIPELVDFIERIADATGLPRSEEHTSELQSRENLVCRLLL